MEKKYNHKKVPRHSSQSDNESEIEKKVDDILSNHSEILQTGIKRSEPLENSHSLDRKTQLLFFTKNKIKTGKQIKYENKPAKKPTQFQQGTRNKNNNSQKNHIKKQDYDEKIKGKNVSRPQRKILNQKITNIAHKILQPSSEPVHQYFMKYINQINEYKVTSHLQKAKEQKSTKIEERAREDDARKLAKEYEKKLRLERLELQRREKEEVQRKKLEEKRAKEEVLEKEREAKRGVKEREEKLRLEQIAIEKKRKAEEKRNELEKKKAVTEAKKNEQEEHKLKKLEKDQKRIKSPSEQQYAQQEIRSQLGGELEQARLDRQQLRNITLNSQKTDSEPATTNQEAPILFEDAIAQVKPDESTWLDEKIKSEKTGDVDTKNAFRKDSNEVFFNDNSLIEELTTKSKFESPDISSDLKKETFDEIIPDGKILNSDVANKLKTLTLEHLGYSRDAIEEIDFYSLFEPFAYVEIIQEKETLDKRYVLIEMGLSEEETHYFKFIKETLDEFSFNTNDLETKGDSEYLAERIDSIITEYMLDIDTLSKEKIIYYLEKDAIGLGKLDVLMKDPNIEDISCDGSGVSFFLYHRRYGSLKSNIMFTDDDALSDFVVKLAQKCGKHISISEPMLDATMPDGSRIQMTLSTEVTTKGSTFTIRKFSQDPFSPLDIIEFHTMSSEMVAFMWLGVENGINALIAGGTASGKTSTLNAMSLFIPRESKIVSIEETREINLPHPNWIPGVVRSGFGDVVGNKVIGEIDLYDLMKAALRQRPEYILVGEIRGKEAYVLFQAMATGHTVYSTVHADSAQSLIHRLEGKPIEIPRIMLQSLDIVCIQVISRVKNKRARRCKQIIEIIDIDPTTKEILTNEVFHWDPIEDKFVFSGKSYILERIKADKGISREDMIKEIKDRTTLLDWMNSNNIREFKKVATLVARYVDNPIDIMKKIRNES